MQLSPQIEIELENHGGNASEQNVAAIAILHVTKTIESQLLFTSS